MEESETIQEVVLGPYDANSLHIVDVTYIIDPQNFYVRSIKYRKIVKQFESALPTAKVSSLNMGNMVLYNWGQSCGASKYIRGKVVRVIEVEGFFDYDLFAVDYGFVENAVPLEFLWQCKEEFLKVPPLAKFCELSDCFPPGMPSWTAHSTEGFKFCVGNEQCKMLVVSKREEKLIVKLINSSPDDIATMLAKGAYSKLSPFYQDVMWHPTTVRKQHHFLFKQLSINDTLHVKVLAGTSVRQFYVAEVGDYRRHLKEKNNITFYARQEFRICEDHLIEGMILCMRDESRNMYERGLLKRLLIDENKAIIHLVDQGVDVGGPINILKYMPAMCLRTPVLAIFCTADETQAWNNGMETTLTPGLECIITIKRVGYQFESPNFVEVEPIKEPLGAAAISPADLLILEEEEKERAEMEAAREVERKVAGESSRKATVKAAEGEGAAALSENEGAVVETKKDCAGKAESAEADTEETEEGACGTATTGSDQKAYDEALFAEPI